MSADAKPGIGHNNPPPDYGTHADGTPIRPIIHTIYLATDPDGRPTLLSEWEIPGTRAYRAQARRLPGRDKLGLPRPHRAYALERAIERDNKRRRKQTRDPAKDDTP